METDLKSSVASNISAERTTSKGMFWIGCVLTALPALFMLMGAFYGLAKGAELADDVKKMGYDPAMMPTIIAVEICCVIIYLIPRTTLLGAILLTGYLGGATATHVRIHDPAFIFPVVMGIIIWLGVYFRDARVRALVPLRR